MSSEDGLSLPMFKLETWVSKMRLESAYKSSSPSAASSVKSFDCAINSGHEQVLKNKTCHFSYSTPGACQDLERTPLPPDGILCVLGETRGWHFMCTVCLNSGEILAENCHRQI